MGEEMMLDAAHHQQIDEAPRQRPERDGISAHGVILAQSAAGRYESVHSSPAATTAESRCRNPASSLASEPRGRRGAGGGGCYTPPMTTPGVAAPPPDDLPALRAWLAAQHDADLLADLPIREIVVRADALSRLPGLLAD